MLRTIFGDITSAKNERKKKYKYIFHKAESFYHMQNGKETQKV